MNQHKTFYSSRYQEGDEQTYVGVFCPRCDHLNETGWDCLEKGSEHKCEECHYEWILTQSVPD